jgi:histidinol-phosphate/aromatic aminotransferase/cobyric acid decarboxylase-like protein
MTTYDIKQKIIQLKHESGSHSPSIETILLEVPSIKIKVDACFLSNPYATELFLNYLDNDLIKTGKLKDILEYYPPQNYDVSKHISKAIKVDERNIFVANGAIEIIQAVIHNFVSKKICVIIPTFSSYYEFILPHHEVVYYQLKKESNYMLDIQDYIKFVETEKPDTIVLINPNNPNGAYISREDTLLILEQCKW